jgi:hypothetical protein
LQEPATGRSLLYAELAALVALLGAGAYALKAVVITGDPGSWWWLAFMVAGGLSAAVSPLFGTSRLALALLAFATVDLGACAGLGFAGYGLPLAPAALFAYVALRVVRARLGSTDGLIAELWGAIPAVLIVSVITRSFGDRLMFL